MDIAAVCSVLARAPDLNAAHVRSLVAAADGDIGRALDPRTIYQVDLPLRARAYLSRPDETALLEDLGWVAASGAHLLPCTDPKYPRQLLATADAPAMLFVRGDPLALQHAQLAIVGSRSPTPEGRRTAFDFAAWFARAGLTVTSGLASGIDAASHQGALDGGGSTVAVCGTGLDRVYPTQHAALADRIRMHGALVSEFPPRTPPRALNFPRRNRIISGLALGTLVVEAAQQSGSLITARLAGEQGRDVFAIPGSIRNPLAAGCHKLIRDGAVLVTDPADVLAELAPERLRSHHNFLAEEALAAAPTLAHSRCTLDKEYEMLLDAVGFEPATIDVFAARTGLPGQSIASMLLILELEGRVAPYPGGCYGRIPT